MQPARKFLIAMLWINRFIFPELISPAPAVFVKINGSFQMAQYGSGSIKIFFFIPSFRDIDHSRYSLAYKEFHLQMMESKHSQQLQEGFLAFIDNYPPDQFLTFLRRMLLDYLAAKTKTGLPADFSEFLHGLYDLFELLELAGREQNNH